MTPTHAASPQAPPIDFWFDFISPYGWLASRRIDALAARHGRTVRWRPMLLGVTVLKTMGLPPVMDRPLRRDYVPREIDRYLRRHGVTLGRPLDAPPMNPLPAARAFAWLCVHAPQQACAFAAAVLDDYWVKALPMDDPTLLRVAGLRAGVAAATIDQAFAAPEASQLLRDSVALSIESGVCGSPFFNIDGEPFFGVDTLELMDDWLDSGGW